MNTHLFLITAKTNLHVGNESGGDFTIIDKSIQRDPLTKLPCINSSSLKGAINEYCSKAKHWDEDKLIKIFGSDKQKRKNDTQKGSAIFFDAKLLYLPQQDKEHLFRLTTSKEVVNAMNDRIHLFDPDYSYTAIANTEIVNKVFNENCDDDNLPIIARNELVNGESKNLWYEQVLPAETVLYTIIREKGTELKEALHNNKLVQIGANATIGYGYCKFECIHTKED